MYRMTLALILLVLLKRIAQFDFLSILNAYFMKIKLHVVLGSILPTTLYWVNCTQCVRGNHKLLMQLVPYFQKKNQFLDIFKYGPTCVMDYIGISGVYLRRHLYHKKLIKIQLYLN